MTTYRIRVRKWRRGWELYVTGMGVTQVKRLADAERQARDYIETMTDKTAADDVLDFSYELGDLGGRVDQARKLTAEAADIQRQAAANARQVVTDLHNDGIAAADIATLMGLTHSHVSRLLSNYTTTARAPAAAAVENQVKYAAMSSVVPDAYARIART